MDIQIKRVFKFYDIEQMSFVRYHKISKFVLTQIWICAVSKMGRLGLLEKRMANM